LSDLNNHDLWNLLYVQTPPVWRWIFGFLTLGLFTLAGYIVKSKQKEFDDHRLAFNEAIDEHDDFRLDISSLREHHTYMNSKVDMLHKEFSGRFDNLDNSVSDLNTHLINHLDKKNETGG